MVSRIKQVSVFIENQPGRLTAMLEALEKNGIDIRALSISDTADFGIVRMILSDAAKGCGSPETGRLYQQTGLDTQR